MGRTFSIIVPSMVVIVTDRGSRAGCRRKSVIFCMSVCLSRFGIRITKFVITERLWSSAIFKTIMVSLYTRRFAVVHLYSTFLWTPQFSHRGKFIPKIAICRDFWGCRTTFLKPERWNLVWGCWPGTSSKPNFILKNSLKGVYPFGGKFKPKITNFGDFVGCKLTF